MKIIIIGASGTIGKAVKNALENKHEIITASRKGDVRVDLSESDSIAEMYKKVPDLDAVICTAGTGTFGPLDQLADEDFNFSLGNKLMGQINLVRYGRSQLKDNGSFTLTSGVLAHQPSPGTVLISILNSGVEAFVKAMALDMPRGQRINVVCPSMVKETAEKMGWGGGGVSANEVAKLYVQSVEGKLNGEMIGPLHG